MSMTWSTNATSQKCKKRRQTDTRQADPRAAFRSPEAQVEGALALLDDVVRITADPVGRAEINPLLKRLGLWIGLQFRPAVKGRTRVVQRLASGRMVFGDGPLPVPLFGKDRVEDRPPGCGCAPNAPPALDKEVIQEGKLPSASEGVPAMNDAIGGAGNRPAEPGLVPDSAADLVDRTPAQLNRSPPEGISITKVSRGEPRCPFVIEIIGLPLALSVFPQVYDFSGDAVLQLVEPGLYNSRFLDGL